MTNTPPSQAEKKKVELIKKLIKAVEKDWTKDKCRGYAPNCANCQGQILLGHLYYYLDIMEADL